VKVKWTEHMHLTGKKIKKFPCAFKELRCILLNNQLKMVYNALLVSSLTSGIISLDEVNKTNLKISKSPEILF